MRAVVWIIWLSTSTSVRAEHEHHHHADEGDAPFASVLSEHRHGYGASLGVVLANYDATLFSGAYQGAVLGGWWMRGRFGVAASVPAYHLTKNGAAVDGVGDLMVHGHAMLVSRRRFSVDAMLMASAPTGDGQRGLGMGHAMAMPEVGVRWMGTRVSASAWLGYGRMLGGALAHAEHGLKMWPLVEPMNAEEVTASATGMLALAPTLAVGLQAKAATPIGDGDTRVTGGGRVAWLAGRVETSLRLDRGFVGSPFGLRGLLETVVRFD